MPGYVKWPLAVLAAAAVTAALFYVSASSWDVAPAPRIHGAKTGDGIYMKGLYAKGLPLAHRKEAGKVPSPDNAVRGSVGAFPAAALL